MDYRQQLLTLVEQNYEKNLAAKEKQANFYLDGLQDEVQEVVEAIASGKKEYIEFELVDIFWTTLNLIERLHQGGVIDKTTLYQKAYTKFAERLPNIATGQGIISPEEQTTARNQAKEKQKSTLG